MIGIFNNKKFMENYNSLRENVKNVNNELKSLMNDSIPKLLEDDSIKIENVDAMKLRMHQAMAQCSTVEYENFQS